MAITPIRVVEGLWWKSDAYEIRDDHICPTEPATLESYDPWDQYDSSKREKGGQAPYQSLLALIESLGGYTSAGPSYWPLWLRSSEALPPGGAQAILDWCSRFGLLGIFPQMVRRFRGTPRWVVGTGRRWVVEREFERIGAEWIEEPRYRPADRNTSVEELWKTCRLPMYARAGACLPKNHPRYKLPSLLAGDAGLERDRKDWPLPLADCLPTYFPYAKDTDARPFDFPIPGSPEFATIYAEPLHGFLYQAFQFTQICRNVFAGGDSYDPALEKLLQGLSTTFRRDADGKSRESWTSPSLLCTFAQMVVQDLAMGVSLRQCECCGTPYLTEGYQSRYCSPQCGFRHRKRRARARQDHPEQEHQHDGKVPR